MVTRFRLGQWLAGVAVAASLVISAGTARAVDDEERAGARAAATEGFKAYDEKRFADAADLFSRAESLIHSPVHLLYIARSQAALGALVRAQESYRKLVREQLAPNAAPAFRKAVEDAERELKELEPRLPSVTITVPGHGDTAVVEMDGKRVPAALVGVPRPVDPGEHKFRATAEGLRKELTLTLKEGERQNVVLTLEAASAAPPVTAAAPVMAAAPATAGALPPPGAPPEPVPAAPMDQGKSRKTMIIAGWSGIGLGVVGVAAGSILLGLRAGVKSDGDAIFDACNARTCTPAERGQIAALDQDAKKSRDKYNAPIAVSFAVGGVGLAAGVTLLLLAPKSSSSAGTRITPFIGWNSAGLQGSF